MFAVLVAAVVSSGAIVHGPIVHIQPYSIRGVVVDVHEAPVVGATVVASSPSGSSTTISGPTGTFCFSNLPEDTYTLVALRLGFDAVSLPGVTVLSGYTQVAILQMHLTVKTIIEHFDNPVLVNPRIISDVYAYSSNELPKLNVLTALPDPIAAAEAATAGLLVTPGIGGPQYSR